MTHWPTSPPAGDEQIGIPFDATIGARYAAWRRTPEGEAVYRLFCQYALHDVAMGATRLFADELAFRVRKMGHSVNNTYRAELARECAAQYRTTRHLFEFRERRSA